MAIERIDAELCNNCGRCVRSCPADVIREDKEIKKATVQYPDDCVMCFWCLAECPKNAITMSAAKTAPLFTSWG